MAQNVFDSTKTYKCRLINLITDNQPSVPGTLAADTVESSDPIFGNQEFAVFTVNPTPNGTYPPAWVGTYRLPMDDQAAWYDGTVES